MRVRGRRSTITLIGLALVGLCVCPSPASAANLPGQSFNITNLPNGWYYARLEVNPLGALYETTTTNNAESRLLYLGGRPGRRTVLVTPWHGVEY